MSPESSLDDKMATAEKITRKRKSTAKKESPSKTDVFKHSRLLENLMMSPSALSARKFEILSERKNNEAQEDLVKCKQQSQIV